MDLSGKPIAITGASSGIGRATAIACARAGMPVAVAARREDRLAALVKEISSFGGKAIAVRVDVSDQADCAWLVEQTVKEFGSIYSVFANAGYGHEGPMSEMSDSAVRAMFDTNFFGTLNTIRPALPHFLKARAGHIMVCSSCLAKSGMPFHGTYSATKSAQEHITRALRIELSGSGVYASSVHPVGTSTEFFESKDARRSPNSGATIASTPPRWMLQPPERVANAVVSCLRRPRPEVWTSIPARLIFGISDLSPRFTDALLRRFAARHFKDAAPSARHSNTTA